MKIFRGIDAYHAERGACVTSGTFDGVHIGHRKILSRLAADAKSANLESVMVTFDPHPRRVLFPEQTGLELITTLDEKLDLLSETGIDAVIVQPFTLEFSRTSAMLYVRDLLVNKVGMQRLVIGYDHQFGKNREGSIDQLRELAPLYNFQVEEIPAQDIDDVNVSSTKIRYSIKEGDMQTANSFLDYTFFMTGLVKHGSSRGRLLGYPTANIHINSEEKIRPAKGVYAVSVEWDDQRVKGMANIGTNPTFVEDGPESLEVHLFDHAADLYDQSLKVNFHHRIRDERKFASSDELVDQLNRDKAESIALLNE